MIYTKRFIRLWNKIWNEFEKTVKVGTVLTQSVLVKYPRGIKVKELLNTTDGLSCFRAVTIIANPDCVMHIGHDIIVATGKITFVDFDVKYHHLEPDVINIDWICRLLDYSTKAKVL